MHMLLFGIFCVAFKHHAFRINPCQVNLFCLALRLFALFPLVFLVLFASDGKTHTALLSGLL